MLTDYFNMEEMKNANVVVISGMIDQFWIKRRFLNGTTYDIHYQFVEISRFTMNGRLSKMCFYDVLYNEFILINFDVLGFEHLYVNMLVNVLRNYVAFGEVEFIWFYCLLIHKVLFYKHYYIKEP